MRNKIAKNQSCPHTNRMPYDNNYHHSLTEFAKILISRFWSKDQACELISIMHAEELQLIEVGLCLDEDWKQQERMQMAISRS